MTGICCLFQCWFGWFFVVGLFFLHRWTSRGINAHRWKILFCYRKTKMTQNSREPGQPLKKSFLAEKVQFKLCLVLTTPGCEMFFVSYKQDSRVLTSGSMPFQWRSGNPCKKWASSPAGKVVMLLHCLPDIQLIWVVCFQPEDQCQGKPIVYNVSVQAFIKCSNRKQYLVEMYLLKESSCWPEISRCWSFQLDVFHVFCAQRPCIGHNVP